VLRAVEDLFGPEPLLFACVDGVGRSWTRVFAAAGAAESQDVHRPATSP
jgi:hypothetical protein